MEFYKMRSISLLLCHDHLSQDPSQLIPLSVIQPSICLLKNGDPLNTELDKDKNLSEKKLCHSVFWAWAFLRHLSTPWPLDFLSGIWLYMIDLALSTKNQPFVLSFLPRLIWALPPIINHSSYYFGKSTHLKKGQISLQFWDRVEYLVCKDY